MTEPRNIEALVNADKRRLESAAPTLAKAIKLYAEEMSGVFGAADPIRLKAFTDLEGLRRRILTRINKTGLLINQRVKGEDGTFHDVQKANPLIGDLIRIYSTLGYTAAEMDLSKKSNREAGNAAHANELTRERLRRLRSSPPLGLPPVRGRVAAAASDIETTAAGAPPPEEPQPS